MRRIECSDLEACYSTSPFKFSSPTKHALYMFIILILQVHMKDNGVRSSLPLSLLLFHEGIIIVKTSFCICGCLYILSLREAKGWESDLSIWHQHTGMKHVCLRGLNCWFFIISGHCSDSEG